MEKSGELNELFKALSKAQSEIHGAKADSNNPFFKSKYADLESVWSAIREPLAKNGLAVSQIVDGDNLITMLGHESGQYISGTYVLNPKDKSPQAVGSATSYARRYSLAAIVGVFQTDDDAEKAQEPHREKTLPNYAPQTDKAAREAITKPYTKFALKEDIAELYAIARAKGYPDDEIKKVIFHVSGAKILIEVPRISLGVVRAYFESNDPGSLK